MTIWLLPQSGTMDLEVKMAVEVLGVIISRD